MTAHRDNSLWIKPTDSLNLEFSASVGFIHNICCVSLLCGSVLAIMKSLIYRCKFIVKTLEQTFALQDFTTQDKILFRFSNSMFCSLIKLNELLNTEVNKLTFLKPPYIYISKFLNFYESGIIVTILMIHRISKANESWEHIIPRRISAWNDSD